MFHQLQENLPSVSFWGRIRGVHNDYLVARSLTLDDSVNKSFYFSQDGGLSFAKLPQVDEWMSTHSAAVRGRFTGDPAHIYRGPNDRPGTSTLHAGAHVRRSCSLRCVFTQRMRRRRWNRRSSRKRRRSKRRPSAPYSRSLRSAAHLPATVFDSHLTARGSVRRSCSDSPTWSLPSMMLPVRCPRARCCAHQRCRSSATRPLRVAPGTEGRADRQR